MVIKGLPSIITELDQQTFYELDMRFTILMATCKGMLISGLWRLLYFNSETGRRLMSIHNFSNVVPIDNDGYDGLVATL
ncbi:hypothetical protein ACOBV9_20250 (plasmid) [Pseudoalteromonas espejiana]